MYDLFVLISAWIINPAFYKQRKIMTLLLHKKLNCRCQIATQESFILYNVKSQLVLLNTPIRDNNGRVYTETTGVPIYVQQHTSDQTTYTVWPVP